jgi:hypothetical protein
MAGPGPVGGAPIPGQPGPPFMPPPFPQRRPRRTISRNKLLLIILAVVGVFVLVAGGVGFVLYNRATEINRSTPTVAVDQFLGAAFVDKDNDRVRLFACPQWTEDRTREIQGRFDPEVKVTWGSIVVQSRQGHQAVAIARMRLVFQGFVDFQDWRFEVVEDNGWRVCSAGPA